MYIKDELIDSVEINPSLIRKINLLKLKLEEKHNDILDLSDDEPEYFIDGIPSRISKPTVKKIITQN